jgi:hypothetical protein
MVYRHIVYTYPMPRKLRFQIMLEERQLTALRKREAETGAPVAAQVRLAIDAWLGLAPKKKGKR